MNRRPDPQLIEVASSDARLSEQQKHDIRAECSRVGFAEFWSAVWADRFAKNIEALVEEQDNG